MQSMSRHNRFVQVSYPVLFVSLSILMALALISATASAGQNRGIVTSLHTGVIDLWGGARAFIWAMASTVVTFKAQIAWG
jgi:hypothetical protein